LDDEGVWCADLARYRNARGIRQRAGDPRLVVRGMERDTTPYPIRSSWRRGADPPQGQDLLMRHLGARSPECAIRASSPQMLLSISSVRFA
jgi:hypothetical protein